MPRQSSPRFLGESTRASIDPRFLLGQVGLRRLADQGFDAVLAWGKAAYRTKDALSECRIPALVIGPEGDPESERAKCAWRRIGEHPIPGPGSFAAGEAILEFFDALRRAQARRLAIFLSGGASSLAWVRPAGLSEADLRTELRRLYAAPLNIAKLNAARAKLCRLKGGGAARWLHRLAPKLRAEAFVISDVLPFGPEVVGSGPFWDPRIPHRVLADNSTWVSAVVRSAGRSRIPVLDSRAGTLGSWQEWVEELAWKTESALARLTPGILIRGGEPQMKLEPGFGHGGRQTQIAAALGLRLWPRIASGEVEIACLSSDGVDGTSGGAGAFWNARVASYFRRSPSRQRLATSIREFDTAGLLRKAGGLIPRAATGTNVQDVVLISVLV